MAVRQLCPEAQKGDNRCRDSDRAKGQDHPSTGLLRRHVTQRLRVWCWDLLSGWDPALTLDSQVTPGELNETVGSCRFLTPDVKTAAGGWNRRKRLEEL